MAVFSFDTKKGSHCWLMSVQPSAQAVSTNTTHAAPSRSLRRKPESLTLQGEAKTVAFGQLLEHYET